MRHPESEAVRTALGANRHRADTLVQREVQGTPRNQPLGEQDPGRPDRRVAGKRQLGAGVKIRSLATLPGRSGASTKVVSEMFISLAIRCIASLGIPSASSTTASWLPVNGVAVKTSTT